MLAEFNHGSALIKVSYDEALTYVTLRQNEVNWLNIGALTIPFAVSMTGNLLTWAGLRHQAQMEGKPAYVHQYSLIVCDLLVGILSYVYGLRLAILPKYEHMSWYCWNWWAYTAVELMNGLIPGSILTSVLLVTGMALDRSAAFKDPILYATLNQRKRAIWMNVVAYLIGLGLGILLLVEPIAHNGKITNKCWFRAINRHPIYDRIFGLVYLSCILVMICVLTRQLYLYRKMAEKQRVLLEKSRRKKEKKAAKAIELRRKAEEEIESEAKENGSSEKENGEKDQSKTNPEQSRRRQDGPVKIGVFLAVVIWESLVLFGQAIFIVMNIVNVSRTVTEPMSIVVTAIQISSSFTLYWITSRKFRKTIQGMFTEAWSRYCCCCSLLSKSVFSSSSTTAVVQPI